MGGANFVNAPFRRGEKIKTRRLGEGGGAKKIVECQIIFFVWDLLV